MKVNAVGEGDLDIAVAGQLLRTAGLELGIPYVKHGKANIDAKIAGYNNAARHTCWLVLRDLDRDAECPPELAARLLPEPAERMQFRIAQRSVESWLLGDRNAIARFLSVAQVRIPRDPENLPNAKIALIDIARTSNRRDIREGLVPSVGSRRIVGPEYSATMTSFVDQEWSIERAIAGGGVPSLSRALDALRSKTLEWAAA